MTIIHDSDLTNKQKDMAVHHIPIHEIYQETPIEELKRLQLEINKDTAFHFDMVRGNWGDKPILTQEEYDECYSNVKKRIEDNTARIAEIILNEL